MTFQPHQSEETVTKPVALTSREKCLQDEDTDVVDTPCPTCGEPDTVQRGCYSCGGEGCFDGYEEDPLWYAPGEFEDCDTCAGTGYLHWCSTCGHDFTFNIPGETRVAAGVDVLHQQGNSRQPPTPEK